MKKLIATTALAALISTTAVADEISEALQNAIDAYEEGDTQYALEELEYAKQLLLSQKTDALVEFLPEPPDGWSREINTDMNAGLAMMGGGTAAEARYEGDGQRITVTIMADSPMVNAMTGMIANAALLGAKIERVGREKFMVQDGEINGLIDRRILVKSAGGEVDTMLQLLETMDFKSLGEFGV